MELISSCIVAILFSGGVYLLLRRSPVDLVFGLALISTGTILLLIAVGGWDPEGHAPLLVTEIHADSAAPPSSGSVRYADPLPQALILTALVIGFGMITYVIALVSRRPEARRVEPFETSSTGGRTP